VTARAPNLPRASGLLAELFEGEVAAYELRGTADPAFLLPEEARSCDVFRPKRLAEFAAGRLCARHALDALNIPGFAVCSNADRSPRWPDGVVGSITHTVGFCGAVAAVRGSIAAVGIDAELVARVTGDVRAYIFTPGERAALALLDADEQPRAAAAAFSAKEALYKCQFAITRRWLDYPDVSIELAGGPARGTFIAHPATSVGRNVLRAVSARGRYRFEGPLVVTGVSLSHEEAGAMSALRVVVA
jgi:4'-phosphopantetheinyl transferase EntD